MIKFHERKSMVTVEVGSFLLFMHSAGGKETGTGQALAIALRKESPMFLAIPSSPLALSLKTSQHMAQVTLLKSEQDDMGGLRVIVRGCSCSLVVRTP